MSACKGAAPVSSDRMIAPSLNLSPVLTLISRTVPESGAGTSVLGFHLVARLDEDLDHRDVLEVADVGNLDVDQTTHCSVLGSAHTVQGAARPVSILYLAMASATIAGLIAPSSASALSAATAT